MRNFSLLTTLLALSTPALAQEGFDAHGLHRAPDDGDLQDLLFVWRPEAQTPKSFSASGIFEYADQPLVLVTEDANGTVTEETLLDHVFGMHAGVSVGLHERVALTAGAPIWLSSRGADGVKSGVGIGDVSVSAPIGIIVPDETDGGFGLSVVPTLSLPSGDQARLLGYDGVSGGGALSAGYNTDVWQVVANVGVDQTPTAGLGNIVGGPILRTRVGGSYLVREDLALRGEVRFDPYLRQGESTLEAAPLAGRPGEAIFSARGRYDKGINWTLGGATGLTAGATAARFRFFAGIGWTMGKDGPADLDLDGFVDSLDACPTQAETVNNYADDDGCPDALADLSLQVFDPYGKPAADQPVFIDGAEVGRTDSRGILQLKDQVPGETLSFKIPGTSIGYADVVVGDWTLEEGAQQRQVDIEWLPGTISVYAQTYRGDPIAAEVQIQGPAEHSPLQLDEYGEGMMVLEAGDWTLFASAPEFGTDRKTTTVKAGENALVEMIFTLQPAVIHVTEEEVVLLDQIRFDFDKATIKAQSADVVEQVATALLSFPEIKTVEIQGHTDDKGSNRYNQELSQRRVEAVTEALAAQGVAPERMQAVGYGEACPLESNRDEEGRAANRRVQFIITDPAPAEGVPCHDGNKARTTKEQVLEIEFSNE